MSEETFWNFEPCEAEKVTITVAAMPEFAGYWAAEQGLVGTRHPAIKVTYKKTVFYLDDQFGKGWRKVTEEQGSPLAAHSQIMAEEGSVELRY